MVHFPEALLSDPKLRPLSKYLYLLIQVAKPASMSQLIRVSGVSRAGVSRSCQELADQGWIRKVSKGRIVVPLPNLPKAVQEQMVRDLYSGLSSAQHKGEYIMKRWLDYLIAAEDYTDNARPSFLQNPLTGEPLEYDRLYHRGYAFEFNGPQHYGPTAAFKNTEEYRQQRSRDLIKRALSAEHGISLVVITLEDLSLVGMSKKIPPTLMRPDFDPDGPYVKALEQVSTDYRATVIKAMTKDAQGK